MVVKLQEEIEQKTFNIMISTTKLSARTVLRAVKAAFRLYRSKASQGKQSVRTLLRQNRGVSTPDRAYSELENTTLTQRPRLTAVSADGLNNYFTSYTRYVKDQVFGRDQWISLQSAAETTLFQKTQSGGILLGREHMMFARHYSILKNEEKGPWSHAA